MPFVAENRDLVHKIGVTTSTVESRIGGARLDPTYLMATGTDGDLVRHGWRIDVESPAGPACGLHGAGRQLPMENVAPNLTMRPNGLCVNAS